VLLVFGAGIALLGELAFKRIGTNVFPFRPTLAIAHDGIYGWLRNPMYVGMAFGVLGLVVAFGMEWTLLLAVPGALVIHYGVVLREERYLERKFGEPYRAYKARVPRYGIRLFG
jgi:protein-S-isoprenylcysteine O-methyltransferase Ste14